MVSAVASDFNVVINSPNELIWEGRAKSVSSTNSVGAFDILPGHANFVTMIESKPIIIRTGTGEHSYTYENAVLSVQGGTVTIYSGI